MVLMRRGSLPLILCLCCCSLQKSTNSLDDFVILDFTKCTQEARIKHLRINPPSGYHLSEMNEHGFCEYRFKYKDGTILYVTTDIYSGSKLNYQNRLKSNIQTYSVNRSENDTIRINGLGQGNTHWLEWICGSFAVGYVEVKDSAIFNKAIKSIELKD